MDIKLFWAIISSILTIISFVPYLVDIFKKKTQPHIYSWLVWSLLQTVGSIAMFKGGAGYGAWSLGIGAFFCVGIFILSFRNGTKNIKKFDIYCLVGAILALSAYIFIDNPLYSVILVALTDVLGFLPTFRKGFEEPYSETLALFLISGFTNLISLFAIQHYSVTTVLYELVLFLANTIMCSILITKRKVIVKSS